MSELEAALIIVIVLILILLVWKWYEGYNDKCMTSCREQQVECESKCDWAKKADTMMSGGPQRRARRPNSALNPNLSARVQSQKEGYVSMIKDTVGPGSRFAKEYNKTQEYFGDGDIDTDNNPAVLETSLSDVYADRPDLDAHLYDQELVFAGLNAGVAKSHQQWIEQCLHRTSTASMQSVNDLDYNINPRIGLYRPQTDIAKPEEGARSVNSVDPDQIPKGNQFTISIDSSYV